MADLSTSYMGLKLRNPVIAGSSGLTGSVENIRKIIDKGAGAVVLKSLFEEQINHDISKTFGMSENPYGYPETMDYITQYTRENDLEKYLELIRLSKEALSVPVIASINCISSSEWVSFAKSIQQAGADAIELNIFILPSDPHHKGSENEEVYLDILSAVLKEVNIPVAAKISCYFSGLANMAMQLSWTGISGLVLFNRFYSPDIDIDKLVITSSNVFSNPEEIALPLRWVAMLSNKVQCDIAASTGIHSGTGVIKQLLAGAKAVQIASVLYKKGFDVIPGMIKELEEWMNKHHFSSTGEFIGKMSLKEASSPAAYKRVQFMKPFAGIE